jgi:omega-amidase
VKQSVRVSVVQFAPQRLDPAANARRMVEFVEREVREHRAELVVFPELSNVGYLSGTDAGLDEGFAPRYYQSAEPISGHTTRALGQVAKRSRVHVIVGVAEVHPTVQGMLFNSSVLIGSDGEIGGVQRKVHIPRIEKHYFVPGDRIEVFETQLGRLGMQVCYDDRFPEVARVQALRGAEMIVAVFAGTAYGNRSADELTHRAVTRALENAVYYVICNRSGAEDGAVFMGHSVIADPRGGILAASESCDEEVIRAELTNDQLLQARIYLSTFRDRRPDLYGPISASIADVLAD